MSDCYVCDELRLKISEARTSGRDNAAEWWGAARRLHIDTDTDYHPRSSKTETENGS